MGKKRIGHLEIVSKKEKENRKYLCCLVKELTFFSASYYTPKCSEHCHLSLSKCTCACVHSMFMYQRLCANQNGTSSFWGLIKDSSSLSKIVI